MSEEDKYVSVGHAGLFKETDHFKDEMEKRIAGVEALAYLSPTKAQSLCLKLGLDYFPRMPAKSKPSKKDVRKIMARISEIGASLLTILTVFMLSEGYASAPFVGLLCQIFWLGVVFYSRAYGLILVTVIMTIVYLRMILLFTV